MKATLRIRLRLLLPLALLIVAALFGCGRNKASHLLVPTGIQPAPPDSSSITFGFTRHDTVAYTGIVGPPYPPAVVTLIKDGQVVATGATGGNVREFRFTHLSAGLYQVLSKSHGFAQAGISVLLDGRSTRDAGDIYMPAQSESLNSSGTFVVGTMPGFSVDDMNAFSSSMNQNSLGVWTYPGDFASQYTIAAGTYRFKFVTDMSSTANHLIGWGGDSTAVLTAPCSGVPVRFASGPAQDLKVTFPTTGDWLFTFDERRLTFSIAPYVPSPGKASRTVRSRTPR